MKKDVGLIVQFDDVEYSEEETSLLLGRFALLLAEIAEEIRENKNARDYADDTVKKICALTAN